MSLQKLNSIALFVLLSFAGFSQVDSYTTNSLGKTIRFYPSHRVFYILDHTPQPFIGVNDTSSKTLLIDRVVLHSKSGSSNNFFSIPDSLGPNEGKIEATFINGTDSSSFDIYIRRHRTSVSIYHQVPDVAILLKPDVVLSMFFGKNQHYSIEIYLPDLSCMSGITPVIDSFHVRLFRSGHVEHDFIQIIKSDKTMSLPSDFTIVAGDVLILDQFHSHLSTQPQELLEPTSNEIVIIATEPEGYPEADSGRSED